MQTLLDCRSCAGFVPPGAGACPCCGAAVKAAEAGSGGARALGGRARRAAFGLEATGLMAVSLMACYGLPMCDDNQKVDSDHDGYFVSSDNCILDDQYDCDDTRADVHPGANDPEGDNIDQNCDGEDGIATGTGGSAGATGGTGGSTGGTGGSTGGTGGTGGSTGGTGGTTTST